MDYYVKQANGEQVKVTDAELLGMVDAGVIQEETPVRKALLPNWSKAKDIPLLQDCFNKRCSGAETAEDTTVYQNSFIPVRAGVLLRFQTWMLDFVLILILFLIVAACVTGILSVVGLRVEDGVAKFGNNYLNVTVRADQTADRKGALVEDRLQKRTLAQKKYQEELDIAKAKLKKAKKEYGDKIAQLRKNRATKADFEKVEPIPEITFPKPPPVKAKISRWNEMRKPTITDDAFEGCYFGSVWYNAAKKQTYVCLSGKKNNAVWMTLPMFNSIANLSVMAFIFLVFLLWFCPLMLRSQTLGMWYFGIFLSRAEDPKQEVLEFRAFFYLLISALTFYLNPLLYIFHKPGIAELLTGTRLICIASQKR